MEPKANPVCRPGQRNIYCPYYSKCLDYVSGSEWEFWDCSCCPNITKRCSATKDNETTFAQNIAFYDPIMEEVDDLERVQ
jgi:hypothetical protein